ncbi:MAG TPA: histidine kinase dimerization/phospho-acceptor domain-containing protein [Planctomycetota bacterium]|jgi:signal transduction histidine kinase|nr:histidine kinase dimerization/phospho-acceptor domain-containing protein [Planctomycetota bacterium]
MTLRGRYLRNMLLVALPPAVVMVPLFGLAVNSSVERSASLDLEQALARGARDFSAAVDEAIDSVLRKCADPDVAEAAALATAQVAGKPREAVLASLEEGDRTWATPASPLETEILSRALSIRLRRDVESRAFAEIFLTDRAGALIAASGRTSDFQQCDEGWWKAAWARGRGEVFVGDIEFDESAGVSSIQVAAPVRAENGSVAGVLKAVVDVRGLLERTREGLRSAGATCALFSRAGERVDGEGSASPWSSTLARRILAEGSGTTTASGDAAKGDRDSLAAFLPIRVEDRMGKRTAGEETYFLAARRPRPPLASTWPVLGLVAGMEAILLGLMTLVAWRISRGLEGDIRNIADAADAAARGEQAPLPLPKIEALGTLARRVADLRDRTSASEQRLRTIAGELEKARSSVHAGEQRRADFLRAVSHEIRTPITAIRSFAEILMRYAEDPAMRQEFLRIIETESGRLNDLLQDLLDFNRPEEGPSSLPRGPVSIREILGEAVRNLGGESRERQVEFVFQVPSELSDVLADATGLRRTLRTLLELALRVTRPGQRIGVHAAELGEEIECAIAMGGSGVPREERERIFEAFGLDPDSPSDLPKGSGLALPLCRRTIQRMGGRLALAEVEGAACAFVLHLRVPSVADATARGATTPLP